jgi:post-segregation antitoxin (ccd killing protein)
MATLQEAGGVLTKQLRERVERLVSTIADDGADFGDVARLADAVGELADTIAATYMDLEQRLMDGLFGGSRSGRDDGEPELEHEQEKQPRDEPRSQRAEQDGGAAEDMTKEELLERAREVGIEGRSSMSKHELAEAVEAEESVTKEELLERAREAGIEGRSSMTKEELRHALREGVR